MNHPLAQNIYTIILNKVAGKLAEVNGTFEATKAILKLILPHLQSKGEGVVLDEKISKEEIIASIKARILKEYLKHPTLDWAELAAIKIYGNFNITGFTNEPKTNLYSNTSPPLMDGLTK